MKNLFNSSNIFIVISIIFLLYCYYNKSSHNLITNKEGFENVDKITDEALEKYIIYMFWDRNHDIGAGILHLIDYSTNEKKDEFKKLHEEQKIKVKEYVEKKKWPEKTKNIMNPWGSTKPLKYVTMLSKIPSDMLDEDIRNIQNMIDSAKNIDEIKEIIEQLTLKALKNENLFGPKGLFPRFSFDSMDCWAASHIRKAQALSMIKKDVLDKTSSDLLDEKNSLKQEYRRDDSSGWGYSKFLRHGLYNAGWGNVCSNEINVSDEALEKYIIYMFWDRNHDIGAGILHLIDYSTNEKKDEFKKLHEEQKIKVKEYVEKKKWPEKTKNIMNPWGSTKPLKYVTMLSKIPSDMLDEDIRNIQNMIDSAKNIDEIKEIIEQLTLKALKNENLFGPKGLFPRFSFDSMDCWAASHIRKAQALSMIKKDVLDKTSSDLLDEKNSLKQEYIRDDSSGWGYKKFLRHGLYNAGWENVCSDSVPYNPEDIILETDDPEDQTYLFILFLINYFPYFIEDYISDVTSNSLFNHSIQSYIKLYVNNKYPETEDNPVPEDKKVLELEQKFESVSISEITVGECRTFAEKLKVDFKKLNLNNMETIIKLICSLRAVKYVMYGNALTEIPGFSTVDAYILSSGSSDDEKLKLFSSDFDNDKYKDMYDLFINYIEGGDTYLEEGNINAAPENGWRFKSDNKITDDDKKEQAEIFLFTEIYQYSNLFCSQFLPIKPPKLTDLYNYSHPTNPIKETEKYKYDKVSVDKFLGFVNSLKDSNFNELERFVAVYYDTITIQRDDSSNPHLTTSITTIRKFDTDNPDNKSTIPLHNNKTNFFKTIDCYILSNYDKLLNAYSAPLITTKLSTNREIDYTNLRISNDSWIKEIANDETEKKAARVEALLFYIKYGQFDIENTNNLCNYQYEGDGGGGYEITINDYLYSILLSTGPGATLLNELPAQSQGIDMNTMNIDSIPNGIPYDNRYHCSTNPELFKDVGQNVLDTINSKTLKYVDVLKMEKDQNNKIITLSDTDFDQYKLNKNKLWETLTMSSEEVLTVNDGIMDGAEGEQFNYYCDSTKKANFKYFLNYIINADNGEPNDEDTQNIANHFYKYMQYSGGPYKDRDLNVLSTEQTKTTQNDLKPLVNKINEDIQSGQDTPYSETLRDDYYYNMQSTILNSVKGVDMMNAFNKARQICGSIINNIITILEVNGTIKTKYLSPFKNETILGHYKISMDTQQKKIERIVDNDFGIYYIISNLKAQLYNQMLGMNKLNRSNIYLYLIWMKIISTAPIFLHLFFPDKYLSDPVANDIFKDDGSLRKNKYIKAIIDYMNDLNETNFTVDQVFNCVYYTDGSVSNMKTEIRNIAVKIKENHVNNDNVFVPNLWYDTKYIIIELVNNSVSRNYSVGVHPLFGSIREAPTTTGTNKQIAIFCHDYLDCQLIVDELNIEISKMINELDFYHAVCDQMNKMTTTIAETSANKEPFVGNIKIENDTREGFTPIIEFIDNNGKFVTEKDILRSWEESEFSGNMRLKEVYELSYNKNKSATIIIDELEIINPSVQETVAAHMSILLILPYVKKGKKGKDEFIYKDEKENIIKYVENSKNTKTPLRYDYYDDFIKKYGVYSMGEIAYKGRNNNIVNLDFEKHGDQVIVIY